MYITALKRLNIDGKITKGYRSHQSMNNYLQIRVLEVLDFSMNAFSKTFCLNPFINNGQEEQSKRYVVYQSQFYWKSKDYLME